jgi:site-specific DNA recombinase
VQRWNLPEGWVISARPAHPAIVTETDFIAAQDQAAQRGPDSPAGHHYLLAGLLRCGTCQRILESCWSNGKPAYRCRHGHTTATRPDSRPPNAYIREDQILARLPALGILLGTPARSRRKLGTAHPPVPAGAAAMISYLRAKGITIIYDPGQRTLCAGSHAPVPVTIDSPSTAKRRQQGDKTG